MSIPSEYREICEMLLTATRERRINWIQQGGNFSVRLPDFSLEMWAGRDEREETEFVAMGLREPKGRGFDDHWYVEEGDEDFPMLKELYSAARRQVRLVPQKLEALRQLLRSGQQLGMQDDNSRSQNRD